MKIGLACVLRKEDDIKFNLNNAMATLILGKQNNLDLVLFGQDYLSGPLSEDSQALFQIKLTCVSSDIACGIGYINEENQSAYLVINSSGEVISNSSDPFTYMDKSVNVTLGQNGFNSESETDITFWPILSHSTPKEWFNSELSKYREASRQLGDHVLLVNSFDEQSYGGGFYIHQDRFIVNQPMEQKGLSICKLTF